MSIKTPELLPCPFCGGPGELCQIPSAAGGDRYIWIAKCGLEEEFMANIVMPDNRTVGQWVKPQIHEAYLSGKMPALLPAKGETDGK